MMVSCYLCGKEYLTEADPHAFIFKGDWKNNCGCYFSEPFKKDLTFVATILGQDTLTDANIFMLNVILDKYRG